MARPPGVPTYTDRPSEIIPTPGTIQDLKANENLKRMNPQKANKDGRPMPKCEGQEDS